MALQHLESGQSVQVASASFTDGPSRKTVALFKTSELEVIRLVLPRGKSMPMHKVLGDITVHCLEGRLTLQTQGGEQTLVAGDLVYLGGGVPHGLVALEDVCALLHIVLRPSEPATP